MCLNHFTWLYSPPQYLAHQEGKVDGKEPGDGLHDVSFPDSMCRKGEGQKTVLGEGGMSQGLWYSVSLSWQWEGRSDGAWRFGLEVASESEYYVVDADAVKFVGRFVLLLPEEIEETESVP